MSTGAPATDAFSQAIAAYDAKDFRSAVSLFEKAAQSRELSPQIQQFLGVAYALGDDAPRDLVKARRWLEPLANVGYAWPQYYLGKVETSPQSSAAWMIKAGEQGFLAAAVTLAGYYAEGYGVEKDLAEACKWQFVAEQYGDMSADEGTDCQHELPAERLATAKAGAAQLWLRKGQYKKLRQRE